MTNYFILKDLGTGDIDAVIITKASKEEVLECISKAKMVEDYTYETLIENLPKDAEVVECFNKSNIIYY